MDEDIDIDIDKVGVPGNRTAYHVVGQVQQLPSSDRDMYAIYEVGDQMCVYRDRQWWCSPTELVREVLGL